MGLAVPLALGGLSAATGFAQSRAQNRAIGQAQAVAVDNARREQASLVESMAANRQQVMDQSRVIREQRLNQLAQTRGTVMAATTGTLSDSAQRALVNSANAGAARDVNAIDTDLRNAILRINSGESAGIQQIQSSTSSTLAGLNSQRSSPLLAGFSSGLSGFTTGLNIQGLMGQNAILDRQLRGMGGTT